MNIIDKIKLLFLAKKSYEEVKGAMVKNGLKSTEFWLTVITVIVNIWFAVVGLIPADLVAKILAGVAAVYTIARTIVKLTPTTKDDELLDKIVSIVESKQRAS